MASRKLVLIGGGGHCKSVLDVALRMGIYDEIVITDTALQKGIKILGCEVVGDDDLLPELKDYGFANAFITVGSIMAADIRMKLVGYVNRFNYIFPTIVDPTAAISDSAIIGPGSFVGKKAVVNAGAQIGSHCIINTGSIIEHDSIIGDFSHVSVGSILCGNIVLGRESLIGAGTTVIQGKRIGSRVIIGAGSTVLSDVGDNMKVYGIVKNLSERGIS